MKTRKQQDNFDSESYLHKLLNKASSKYKTEEKIRKTKRKLRELFSKQQLSDKSVVTFQIMMEIIKVQEEQKKKQVYENIDEIVEYVGVNPNIKMEELTAEEVADEMMKCVDMNADSRTIDQILSKGDYEMISAGKQVLNKENIEPQEEPTVLYQFNIGDLTEKTINYMYSC